MKNKTFIHMTPAADTFCAEASSDDNRMPLASAAIWRSGLGDMSQRRHEMTLAQH